MLITAEGADGPVGEAELLRCCADMRALAFHVELMRERGLVEACVSYDGIGREPIGAEVSRVTWEGYDCLDAIRSPQVWARAKEAIASAVGDTSLSVVKEVCQLIAASLVRQKLGL